MSWSRLIYGLVSASIIPVIFPELNLLELVGKRKYTVGNPKLLHLMGGFHRFNEVVAHNHVVCRILATPQGSEVFPTLHVEKGGYVGWIERFHLKYCPGLASAPTGYLFEVKNA